MSRVIADQQSAATQDSAAPDDAQALARLAQAQQVLGGSLKNLIAVAESYPNLRSGDQFLSLQAQLEGTENRITVARNRFIESTREYNTLLRKFPNNLTAMLFGYELKPTFTVENEAEISRPPEVNFGTQG